MSTEPIQDLRDRFVEGYERAWNDGEFDLLDELHADDVTVHNVARGEDYADRAALRAFVEEVRREFSDLTFEVVDVVAGDDELVTRWVMTGTNDGPFIGFDFGPTNRSAEWEGVAVSRFAEGRVVEAWWYYDLLGMLGQLGVGPGATPE